VSEKKFGLEKSCAVLHGELTLDTCILPRFPDVGVGEDAHHGCRTGPLDTLVLPGASSDGEGQRGGRANLFVSGLHAVPLVTRRSDDVHTTTVTRVNNAML